LPRGQEPIGDAYSEILQVWTYFEPHGIIAASQQPLPILMCSCRWQELATNTDELKISLVSEHHNALDSSQSVLASSIESAVVRFEERSDETQAGLRLAACC
jgi:hypothetical protein